MDRRNCGRCDYYFCDSGNDSCSLDRFNICFQIPEKLPTRKIRKRKLKKKEVVIQVGGTNAETENNQ